MAATAFGTMAEDGSSKFITSLTTVGDTFNDVNDAAQNMFDNSTTDSQTLESNMRKLQDALIPLGDMLTQLANEVLPPIVKAVKAFAEWFAKLPAPVQNFTVILGILLAAFTGTDADHCSRGVAYTKDRIRHFANHRHHCRCSGSHCGNY